MSWLVRLKYSLYLFIATTMTVVLALSILEGMGLLVGFPIQELPFRLTYVLPVAIVSYLVAPNVARWLSLPGAETPEERSVGRAEFDFGVRVGALVLVGGIAAALLGAALWLAR